MFGKRRRAHTKQFLDHFWTVWSASWLMKKLVLCCVQPGNRRLRAIARGFENRLDPRRMPEFAQPSSSGPAGGNPMGYIGSSATITIIVPVYISGNG